MFRFAFGSEGSGEEGGAEVGGREGDDARLSRLYDPRDAPPAGRDAVELQLSGACEVDESVRPIDVAKAFHFPPAAPLRIIPWRSPNGAMDLVQGTYEGGGRLWEASLDLVALLRQADDLALPGASVLELGCGHGLPSIAAMKLGATDCVAIDFNDDVILEVTCANFVINGLVDDVRSGRVRLFSGDWTALPRHLSPARFDLILSAETLYSESTAESLARCLVELLVREKQLALIAAKIHYFGVGGGTVLFKRHLHRLAGALSKRVSVTTRQQIRDGSSNVREILAVQLCAPPSAPLESEAKRQPQFHE